MTTSSRFERQLPDILEDLYLGPTPDYRDEVLATATRSRQRPAWAIPGRWIPMADIASRPAFVPRLPIRVIGLALVIVALLVVATVVFIGSRQTKVPPPFGVARNGQIVYSAGGDIFTADPVTGLSRAIVTGPEMDGNPRYSRDGTRVAFMRRVGASDDAFNLVVGTSDGKDLKVLTTTPLDTDSPYEWSPDGTFLVFTDSSFRVLRIEADGSRASTVIRENAYVQAGAFRPPDGRQILFEAQGGRGHALWVMAADGSGARPLVEIAPEAARDGDFGSVRYSPDGMLIAYLRAPTGDTEQLRLFVMNADGTGSRQLTTATGAWTETDLAWSPDGKWIAFDRWRLDQVTLEWEIQPIGVVSVNGGDVVSTGPTPVSDGAWFDYSPDGTSLVSIPGTVLGAPYPTTNVNPTVIDTATGNARAVDWQVGSMMTWQRLAP